MPNDTAHLKKVVELIGIARQQTAQTLPLETRQSYPIPIFQDGGLRVAFLFCNQIAKPGAIMLIAPNHLAVVNAATGKFELFKKVKPQEFGIGHPEGEVIGAHTLPPGLNYEGSLAATENLYRQYDVLLPAFASRSRRVGPEIKAAAKEFNRLFLLVGEIPLLPYYRAIGHEFNAWLDSISK